jgi:hypothetical protein
MADALTLTELTNFLLFLEGQKHSRHKPWTVQIFVPSAVAAHGLPNIPGCLEARLTFPCETLAQVALFEVDAAEKGYRMEGLRWNGLQGAVNINGRTISVSTDEHPFAAQCLKIMGDAVLRGFKMTLEWTAE